jgi:hypothetical protein
LIWINHQEQPDYVVLMVKVGALTGDKSLTIKEKQYVFMGNSGPNLGVFFPRNWWNIR